MKTRNFMKLLIFTLSIVFLLTNLLSAQEAVIKVLPLDKDWFLEPYGERDTNGKVVKENVYSIKNRITCDVPSTVFAAMVKNGMYKDPFFADNLAKVPEQWFDTHWRYSKSIELTASLAGAYSRLCFEGINYSADVFLNGKKIASADTLKGAFRRFEIDVTGKLKAGKNELEVRVFPPKPGDFTVGFVDWTPRPPDRNMGLFRGVNLRFNGPVSVNNPFVKTTVMNSETGEVSLNVKTTMINHSQKTVNATVKAEIENIVLEQKVMLLPGEEKSVVWSSEKYPQLHIRKARLWWPFSMGEPNLYSLKLTASAENKSSDAISQTFGIREVSSYLNSSGSRAYKVNGHDIQIRGGGWTDDLLLREDGDNFEAQVQYTKLMNLNCIRLEGFWGASEKLYDLCDSYGILLMAGWSCQWEWKEYLGKECDEFGGIKTPEEIDLVARSLTDHVLWLRNHPSIFVWVLGSDMLPRPELEKRYLIDLSANDPTRPTLGACSVRTSEVSGPTGVKMNGPYDYVTPNYWYLDTKNGGAFGFNTETGPGPQVPPIETLHKMFPADKVWPVNKLWDYHSGRNQFNTINNYLEALNKRYGEAKDVDEFVMKAQLTNYEAIRPMFEAFAINKSEAGGVVQWMLNAAWPKLYWQLYDYYLMPNGAFFGTLNALKPLNIIYNYGNDNIYVSNDYQHAVEGLTADIQILDMNSKVVLHKSVPFSMEAYTSRQLFELPEFNGISPVYFADLRIRSNDGKMLAQSFYWLSSKKDIPDFEKTEWYVTPSKEFADFTALSQLPKVEVSKEMSLESHADQTWIKVKLKNKSDNLAFFMELKLKGATGNQLVLPVFWSDNYISLLPEEERELLVKVNTKDLKGEKPVVELSGYNLK